MVRAPEVWCRAHLGPADLHPTVATHVQQHVNVPAAIAVHDDGIVPDLPGHVVTRGGDLTLRPDQHPGLGPEPLELQFVDLRVLENPHRDLECVGAHEVGNARAVAQGGAAPRYKFSGRRHEMPS